MTPHDSAPISRWLIALVSIVIVGNVTLGRSFAHLGVPPLYIGEMTLLALIVVWPEALPLSWTAHALRPSPLGTVAWVMFFSVGFGVLQCVRGVWGECDPRNALQNLVFHIYPLLFFTGVWIGARWSAYLPRLLYYLAWIHGLYGFLFIFVLSPMGFAIRAESALLVEEVPWAGQPSDGAMVLLGLLCFYPNIARVLPLLLLNGFVVLGMKYRAAWAGLAAALPLWSWLAGRTYQFAKLGAVFAALFVAAWVTEVSIPAPTSRGGEISARSLIGRAVAAVDREWAHEFTDDADSQSGTVSWRTGWWIALWEMVHASPTSAVFGPGYGYPIWDHHPEDLHGVAVRTPHNILMYTLAYTGWSGVAVYLAVQLSLAAVMWRVYRQTGQPFGFCYWLAIMIWATFDNSLETPFFAIPFYLVLGLAAAQLVATESVLPTDDDSPRETPKEGRPT